MKQTYASDIEGQGDFSLLGQMQSFITGAAPFVVASSLLITGMNVDMLDGLHADDLVPVTRQVQTSTGIQGGGPLNSNLLLTLDLTYTDARYASSGHSHATLTRGTGLTGLNYNGSLSTTWAVSYGTTAGTAAEGNDSRINNGQTAYSWGNPSGVYLPLTGGTLTGALIGTTIRATYASNKHTMLGYDPTATHLVRFVGGEVSGGGIAFSRSLDGAYTNAIFVYNTTADPSLAKTAYQSRAGHSFGINMAETVRFNLAGQVEILVATGTAPLAVNSTTLVPNLNVERLNGQVGSYYLDWDNFTNKPTITTGTVTSVGMTVPTGLLVSPSSITTNGTFAVTYAAGYSLPSDATQATWTAKQAALSGTGLVKSTGGTISYVLDSSGNWNTAYGWGDHAGLYSLVSHTHTFTSLTSKPSTISGYGITDFLAQTLTGYTTGSNTVITSSHTILNAFRDLQAQVTGFGTSSHPALTLGASTNGLSLAGQVLSLQSATTSLTGAITSTDWNTFNGKQSALSGTGLVKSTGGTISYMTDNSSNWNIAYGWGNPSGVYLPLSGGTLTGALNGTTIRAVQGSNRFTQLGYDPTLTHLPKYSGGDQFGGSIAFTRPYDGAYVAAIFTYNPTSNVSYSKLAFQSRAGHSFGIDTTERIRFNDSGQIEILVTTGTAPLSIASTTLVSNLNVERLNSQLGSYYLDWNNFTNKPTVSGLSGRLAYYTGTTALNYTALVWDNTNTRLGVNNGSPAYTLDLSGDFNIGSGAIRIGGSAGSSGQYLKSAGGSANTWGAVTSGDVTGALGFIPVPTTRTITVNSITGDLTGNVNLSIPVSSHQLSDAAHTDVVISSPAQYDVLQYYNLKWRNRALNFIASADVYGQYSITGGGNAGAGTVYLSLQNDQSSPGASKLYGTDASGVKGWYAQPTGGGGPAYIYGTKSISGGGNIFSGTIYLELGGDDLSPGPNKYYGTNSGASKGFHSLPNWSGTAAAIPYWATSTSLADSPFLVSGPDVYCYGDIRMYGSTIWLTGVQYNNLSTTDINAIYPDSGKFLFNASISMLVYGDGSNWRKVHDNSIM